MERIIPYDVEKKVMGYIAELRNIDRERKEGRIDYNEAIKKTLKLFKTTGAEINTAFKNLELNLADIIQ